MYLIDELISSFIQKVIHVSSIIENAETKSRKYDLFCMLKATIRMSALSHKRSFIYKLLIVPIYVRLRPKAAARS